MSEEVKEILEDEETEAAAADQNAEAEDEEEENPYLPIKLTKTYTFEGKEYSEIDVSGLEDITAKDLKVVEKMYRRYAKGSTVEFNEEFTMEYAMCLISRASKMPLEFFDMLKPQDVYRVKMRAVNFTLLGV